MNEDTHDSGLSFSRVATVRAAGDGVNADLLKLAQARAVDPSIFEEFPPAFFRSEISSSRLDAYSTKMGVSTLKNFAADAATGVAFLRNHDTRQDPIGYSLTGQFIAGGGNGVARVESDFYLLGDPDTLPYIRKIRSGVVRDNSVGFHGGEWICSIDGKDMQQWMSRDGCFHFPGMSYTPYDEAGAARGEPVLCTATIENARLAEYSGVYDGATPGAMVLKARELAVEGRLSDRERTLVEQRYRLHLPSHRLIVPGADLNKERDMEPKDGATPTGTIEKDGIRLADGVLVTPQDVVGERQRMSDLRAALTEAGVDAGKSLIEGVRYLAGEAAKVAGLDEQVRTLKADAEKVAPTLEDGKRYRTDLIEDALKSGVRANGEKFAADTYRKTLEGLPLDVVRQMKDDWERTATTLFSGGRRSVDNADAPPFNGAAHNAIPDAAFRTTF